MPANLTPQYYEAEEEFRRATTPEDKMEALQKMLDVKRNSQTQGHRKASG